jgi:hypothetical protein
MIYLVWVYLYCRSMSRELSIVVKMGSYFSLPDGDPKTYCRRKTLSPFIVDAKSCGLIQIIDHIAEHFMWGSKQYITLYGSSEDSDGVSFQIKSDEHVLEWFEMNLEKGVVYIDAQINDFDGPLQFSPTKRALHLKVRERMTMKTLETPSTPLDLDSRVDHTHLTQATPIKERTTSKKERATSKKDRATHDEEAVGVDEEDMYSDTDSLVALSDINSAF